MTMKKMMKQIDWDEYDRRVTEIENQGMTRSDAQAVVDVEMEMNGEEVYSPFETINS